MRVMLSKSILALSCLIASALLNSASAQFPPPLFPPPPPPVILNGIDPTFGQMCSIPPGPVAPCPIVHRWHRVMQAMARIPLRLSPMPPGPFGPICEGPLGPGPCGAIRRYLAMLEVGQQEFQVRPTGRVGPNGAECVGPLGPGPCIAIIIYLMQADGGSSPVDNFNPRNPQVIRGQGGGGDLMCNGATGPMPCNLITQMSLDRMGGQIPSQGSFGVPGGLNQPQQLAAACARQSGLDIAAFAACTGHQIILPESQQKVLECAVNSSKAQDFAECAAPNLGIKLSDDQRVLVGCAKQSSGDASAFAQCAGGAFISGNLGENEQAILACAADGGTLEEFADCAAPSVLKREQAEVLKCAVDSNSVRDFATCAAPSVGIKMSEDQRVLVNCAAKSDGDRAGFLGCAGAAFLGRNLGPKEQAVLACASQSSGDTGDFASCAASGLLGDDLSKEQKIAITCAAQSQGDPPGMATCAGANMIGMQLNPEQQIAVQCVVSTGGQPYAAAGCMASRLTARELTKCFSDGVGGRGCFGDSNDLVGKDGWLRKTIGGIAGGPNSVFNNPNQLWGGPNSFVRNPDQIWGGDNSFVRNPGQIFGGDNSFVRNPGQIFGGSNSVFNNPSQLLPQPKPVQIGTVGGKRICLPWC